MRKSVFSILVFFVLILVFSVNGDAQNGSSKSKPDFSGTWLLDTKQSKLAMTGRSELPITISHLDPEFRITVPYGSKDHVIKVERVFFTDGRGEHIQGTDAPSQDPSATQQEKKPNSKTEWSGDKIVTVAWLTRGNFVRYQQRDEWSLSRDGKVLTQYRRIIEQKPSQIYMNTTPVPDRKMVYNRM